MITRAFGDSVRLFATAIPVALILGGVLPPQWTAPAAILVLGACTVLYTYHGGMRAVVWTDVLQTAVYLGGGIAAVVLIGRGLDGGWANILQIASAEGKLRIFDLTLGFDRPHTLVAGLLGGGFLAMASHGADQIIVQRLLAAGSLRDARRALIGSGIVVIAQFSLFLLIGVGLWAYYGNATFASPDQIFPSFIIDGMPAGLTGVVIATILAAAMSTMSGSLNALAAATLHDLYIPLFGAPDDAAGLKLSRRFTFAWAIVLIGGALLYRQQGTPVVIIALSIASFTYGGLLGGFFLALFWRRATQVDAILGMTVGILVMIAVVRFSGVAWPWFVLIGTSVTLVIGVLSSLSRPAPPGASP
jgi:Na+/proline symporter